MKPSCISSSRLSLRSAMEADAINLFDRYCSDVGSSRYLTRQPHKEVSETKSFLNKWCCDAWTKDSSDFAWVIALKETNEAIGVFLVQEDGHKAQIHYGIGQHFSGQGFMTEAGYAVLLWLLDHENIQGVWTVCDLENYSSIKVLNKLGFKKEGILEKWFILPAFGQSARDCYIYGFTKKSDEFEASEQTAK
jgi:ribosomal-protein-alanine N-acetyltransferase